MAKDPKTGRVIFFRWGGPRPGSGRPPKPDSGEPHLSRTRILARHPVLASLEIDEKLPSLRSTELRQIIEECFAEGKERFGFRLVHYSIQRHHLHLIAEAKGTMALAQGMKGISVRMARRINHRLGRKGKFFLDRYSARPLKTPDEVRAALSYVLLNGLRHGEQNHETWDQGMDPCSSARYFDGWAGIPVAHPGWRGAPVAPPKTWLLREGWRESGPLDRREVPPRFGTVEARAKQPQPQPQPNPV